VASSACDAVDISHRGGRLGFVRVDGDVLTIPDFSGNRHFNTLGNFLVPPRAALLFIDFTRGDLLHLSGTVEIVWDVDEVGQFAGAERLWRVRVSHGWRRRGAGHSATTRRPPRVPVPGPRFAGEVARTG
jgi:hypothetical protein